MAKQEGREGDGFRELLEQFQRADSRAEYDNAPMTDLIRAVITWALELQLDGLTVGSAINISEAAKGFGVSRATVAEALRPLVETGQLKENPKAPYSIESPVPVLPEPELLFNPESITKRLKRYDGGDLIAPLREIRTADNDDLGSLLVSGLRNTRDPLLKRLDDRNPLMGDTVQVYEKFRFVRVVDEAKGSVFRPWWIEVTFLGLGEEILIKLDRVVREQISLKNRYVSLYRLLASCGVLSPRGGRARISFALELPPPVDLVVKRLMGSTYLGTDFSDMDPPKAPFIRWEFFHVAIEPRGIIGYSVCFLDPESVHICVRDFDVITGPVAEGGSRHE